MQLTYNWKPVLISTLEDIEQYISNSSTVFMTALGCECLTLNEIEAVKGIYKDVADLHGSITKIKARVDAIYAKREKLRDP